MHALRYSLVTFAVIAALAISVALLVRALHNTPPEPRRAGGGIVSSESPAPPPPSAAPAQDAVQGAKDRMFDPLLLPPAGKIGPDLPASLGPDSKAAVSRLQLSTEQQDKVRYVLLSHNIVQSDTAGFTLQLGVVVPQNVPLTPLPHEVADAVPNYRAYSYVIAQDRIAIVGNGRREIGFLISL